MKKIVFMLIVGTVINLHAYGRKITVNAAPETVIDSFKVKFPLTHKVIWETIDSMNYYAVFNIKKTHHIAKFNKDGFWLETIVEMESEKFPSSISEMLTDNYPEFEVFEAQKITSKNHTFYQIHLDNEKTELLVQILANGILLVEMEVPASRN